MNSEYMMRKLEATPDPTEPYWFGKSSDELRRQRERGGFRANETKRRARV